MSQVKNQSFKIALSQTSLRVLLNTLINRNSKTKGDCCFVDKSWELYYWPCWWQKLMIKVLLLETLDEKTAQTTQFYPQVNWPMASGAQLYNRQQALLFPSGFADDSYKKIFHRVNYYKPLGGNGYGLPYYSKNLFCKNKKQKYLYLEPKTKPMS